MYDHLLVQPRPQEKAIASSSSPSARWRQAAIHYTLYLPNGGVVSSYETGLLFRFTLGAGEVLPGLEEALPGMTPGETRRLRLKPEQAFGPHRPELVLEVSNKDLSLPHDLHVGQAVRLALPDREGLQQAYLREKRSQTAIFDLNHPLAGQEITLDVTLVELH